jgi:hypothetical protein
MRYQHSPSVLKRIKASSVWPSIEAHLSLSSSMRCSIEENSDTSGGCHFGTNQILLSGDSYIFQRSL